ncbi:alpha/beta fold hydrolase [Mesorhizobium humile]|uniref:Alpha/beta fold hydrolase n=1 Tax=Mesorhizobium humile TaxID=3072313 RepID=A0ABU4YHQ2_9HYPH|nr:MULTISPECIES: alpha/beta fold hydrolase [unclassified Mesorhizobium]MDX8460549.1 alpha/beta fold hydrolase [Mesorhizobium sp. VK2D]MDX8485362.1 alpha/beta fold hydrolase [Mesorhizobium sp. VK2B]
MNGGQHMLELRVLGDFQVVRDDQPVDLPPSRKTRALLAYLAVTARQHQRERLCEIFWDIPDDPRGALRWSLSKIRQVLGGDGLALVADRNAVALNIDTDYARLAPLVKADLSSRTSEELEAVLASIRGGFLADLSLERCFDYESWRQAIASEVEIVELGILRELVERLADQPRRALPFAQRLRGLVPDDARLAAEIEALEDRVRSATAQAPGSASQSSSARPPQTASKPASSQDPGRAVQFCRALDGTRLAYASTGSGPAILRAAHWMSHLTFDWDSPIWRHWMRELSRQNRLVRYDERCNGLSQRHVVDISFETMLSDLECVVEATGLDRFTLLGLSQSCAVSIAYAIRHPERVSGMILYGGYVKGWRARGDAGEIATREAAATLMRESWGKPNPMFRQAFCSMFIPGATHEHFAWMDDLMLRTVSPDDAWRLQSSFSVIDVSDLLDKVRVPTLVLHARDDNVAPVESGRTMAAGIPGARFIELESQNHILLEGEPAFEEFIDHVRAFIAETAGG